jgi:hypothetical protein
MFIYIGISEAGQQECTDSVCSLGGRGVTEVRLILECHQPPTEFIFQHKEISGGISDRREGIRVQINGHFALDTGFRTNLWRDDGSCYRTDWNKCLMESVISPAYCTLIERMTHTDDGTNLNEYYSVFPEITSADGELALL